MAPVTICWTQLKSAARTDLDHRHRRRAEDRSRYRPSASGEAAAADDDGRDHVELEAVGNSRVADRQARELGRPPRRQAPRRSCRRRLSRARPPRRRASPSARWNQWRRDAGRNRGKKTATASARIATSQMPLGIKNPRPFERPEQVVQPGGGCFEAALAGEALRCAAHEQHHAERDDEGDTLSLVMRRPLMNPHTAPAPIPAAAADIGPCRRRARAL